MSLLESLTAKLPGHSSSPQVEYFFALNIGPEKLTAALWTVSNSKLQVINSAEDFYISEEEIVNVADRLLDMVLDGHEVEPTKILFGVQDSWLDKDDLKDPYLKLLKTLVKELELTPMAYVASSHALVHFLEKQENSPVTAILVGIGKKFVVTTLVRAGKIDGSVAVERKTNLGADVEKGIAQAVKADVLPARILIYGEGNLETQKADLMSYPWMSKLSFLHFPKIEILRDDLEIQSVALAGAVEIDPDTKIDAAAVINNKTEHKPVLLTDEDNVIHHSSLDNSLSVETSQPETDANEKTSSEQLVTEETSEEQLETSADLGFVAGDVTQKQVDKDALKQEAADILDEEMVDDLAQDIDTSPRMSHQDHVQNINVPKDDGLEGYNFDDELLPTTTNVVSDMPSTDFDQKPSLARKLKIPGLIGKKMLIIPVVIVVLLIAAYIFIPKAKVSVYVEPRILEKETQVIADPSIKELDNEGQKIPAEVVDIQISGSGKGVATGKKQVGDSAKGVVVIRNKTNQAKVLAKGTTLTGPGGIKFTLDNSVSIASMSAEDGTWSKANGEVVAVDIGPDGNLPSGSDLSISGLTSDQMVAKSEGNFSGGTSKDVTVVTADDQKRLLAQVAADLRKQAQEQLQGKLNQEDSGKQVLEETLTEEITKRTYSKNVNDQATEFNLDLTAKYQGTAFTEADLRTMVAKLVETNVPEDFMLNLADSETQADVSKIEKDGKVIFTARFRAKLMPRIDAEQIAKLIVGKTPQSAADILRTYDNVLGSDIIITPALPGPLQRLPFIQKNIKVDVGLK